jgi:UDP-perosamine 4-acetyltransferase
VSELLSQLGVTVLGHAGRTHTAPRDYRQSRSYLGSDKEVRARDPGHVRLANGLGSVARERHRADLFNYFIALGFNFPALVHPSAVLAADVVLAEGAQVMAGAVLQPHVRLGRNAIINTCASIDHDCELGAHVHIAPGAVLSGEVRVGDNTHIGTGAVIRNGITIGANCVIGVGAVVIRDTQEPGVYVGTPARLVRGSERGWTAAQSGRRIAEAD